MCELEHDNCQVVVESNVRNALEMFARRAFAFQIEFDNLMSVYTEEKQTKTDALSKLRKISRLKKSSSLTNVSFNKTYHKSISLFTNFWVIFIT